MLISLSGRNQAWFNKLPPETKREYLNSHPKSKFHPSKTEVGTAPVKVKAEPKKAETDTKTVEPTKIKNEGKPAKYFFINLKAVVKKLEESLKTAPENGIEKIKAKHKFLASMLAERGSRMARNNFFKWKKVRGMQLLKLTKQFSVV